ncbi:MAG: TOBE domain-containing protein [Methylotetracoccus sp.]|nr:TOBE domain-containing protein [Methylotetracoccus sp.]
MKASARNQWFGTVTDVHVGPVSAEVFVNLKGGATLVATVTQESVASLGLAKGKEVLALVKAPLVMVVTDLEGYRLSARNQLSGTISHLQKGAVNAEVVIALPGGDSVAATITNESVNSLGLAVGNPATAVFKAGAVILGVAP